MAALKRMIASRGGIHAFAHNDGLMRGIIWVDFHLCTVFHTKPSFAYIHFNSDTTALPNELLEEAAYTSPTSLLQLDMSAIECFNIFYRLHRLSLGMCEKWVGRMDRGTLSDLLYEVNFAILTVPRFSASFLDFEHETGTHHAEHHARADASNVVEAILAAAQIFIYAALCDIPTTTKIFSILLERLRIALPPSNNVLLVWRSRKNLNMLLWVLVVALSVQPLGPSRAWWIGKLMDVTHEMEIENMSELEVVLKHIAWVDTWFDACLGRIWEEVVTS
jgi:hypothetical protein